MRCSRSVLAALLLLHGASGAGMYPPTKTGSGSVIAPSDASYDTGMGMGDGAGGAELASGQQQQEQQPSMGSVSTITMNSGSDNSNNNNNGGSSSSSSSTSFTLSSGNGNNRNDGSFFLTSSSDCNTNGPTYGSYLLGTMVPSDEWTVDILPTGIPGAVELFIQTQVAFQDAVVSVTPIGDDTSGASLIPLDSSINFAPCGPFTLVNGNTNDKSSLFAVYNSGSASSGAAVDITLFFGPDLNDPNGQATVYAYTQQLITGAQLMASGGGTLYDTPSSSSSNTIQNGLDSGRDDTLGGGGGLSTTTNDIVTASGQPQLASGEGQAPPQDDSSTTTTTSSSSSSTSSQSSFTFSASDTQNIVPFTGSNIIDLGFYGPSRDGSGGNSFMTRPGDMMSQPAEPVVSVAEGMPPPDMTTPETVTVAEGMPQDMTTTTETINVAEGMPQEGESYSVTVAEGMNQQQSNPIPVTVTVPGMEQGGLTIPPPPQELVVVGEVRIIDIPWSYPTRSPTTPAPVMLDVVPGEQQQVVAPPVPVPVPAPIPVPTPVPVPAPIPQPVPAPIPQPVPVPMYQPFPVVVPPPIHPDDNPFLQLASGMQQEPEPAVIVTTPAVTQPARIVPNTVPQTNQIISGQRIFGGDSSSSSGCGEGKGGKGGSSGSCSGKGKGGKGKGGERGRSSSVNYEALDSGVPAAWPMFVVSVLLAFTFYFV